MVVPWLFFLIGFVIFPVVAHFAIQGTAILGRKPEPFGIERPDGTFEVLTATYFKVDRWQNLHLYRGVLQVALFKEAEWLYVERGLTEGQVDRRGV